MVTHQAGENGCR